MSSESRDVITRLSVYVLGAIRLTPLLILAVMAFRAQGTRGMVAMLLCGFLEIYLVASLTRSWRWFYLAGFPLLLLGTLYACYTVFYGLPPGRSLALILLTTSPEEIVGFLAISQAKPLLLGILVLWTLYFYLSVRLPKTLRIQSAAASRKRRIYILALLLPITVYVGWDPANFIDGAAYHPTVGSFFFFAGTVPRADAMLHGSQVVKVPYGAHRDGGEEVHVFVLGESARRDSWSVYGYTRPTTPYLDSLKGDAIFLSHALADANITSAAVPIVLTGMSGEQMSATSIRGNIVDLAKEAGYYTAWLENQDITIPAAVGMAADHAFYPPDFKSNILDRHTLDEALLRPYKTELARSGKARFLGIHIMGSHWEYYRRYPAAFGKFGADFHLNTLSIFLESKQTEAQVVDAYDNTVLYTDWFLQQVIEPARKLTVPVTVTFFPDHGEDLQYLDNEAGHGAPHYTPHAYAIPAFVWVNEAYAKAHPDKVAALRNNAQREIRSHDVFGTLADLMGITWPERNPARSFASSEFAPDIQAKLVAGGVLVAPPPAADSH